MQISFQCATTSDIDLLVEFLRQFYLIDNYSFNHQTARQTLDRLISDSAIGRVWIIRDEQTPVGYIVLTFGYSLQYHGRDAFIDEFYIHESHRGKGIGAKAMRFIEIESKRLGVNALHLEVEKGNQAGQELYRKFGFEGHDSLLMTKWIKR